VTLVTAQDCHLCERARHVLASLSEENRLAVREVRWESDEGARLISTTGVPFPPAVYLNGTLAGYGRVSERALRRLFAKVAN